MSAAEGRKRFVILLAVLLYTFGLIMVTSATTGAEVLGGGDQWSYLKRELMYGGLGLFGMMLAIRVPLKVVRRFIGPLLLVAFGLLMLVFVPGLGVEVNGARRWLGAGSLTLQPSEIAKLTVILFLADYLATSRVPETVKEFLRPAGGVALGACLIIFLQNDLGTALVLGSASMVLFVLRGTHVKLLGRIFIPLVSLAAIGIATEPFRRERLLAFINPWHDPQGIGFQLVQGLIAIGSGGAFGHGLGHSVQKVHYVPEAHTDMIYTIISEELGVLGTAFVLVCFLGLAVVGMRIAMLATTRFNALLAVGITSLLCGQAILNLGGVLGLLPLTGVPLPLVSYGGTSLIILFTSIGLLANVATDEQRNTSPQPAD